MIGLHFALKKKKKEKSFLFLAQYDLDKSFNKNPVKKGCVWSRGMFRYQWDGLRILYSPAK